MNYSLKVLVTVFITFFIAHQNLLANDPVPLGEDTLIVTLDCERDYIVDPFVLLVHAGSIIKFQAASGPFSVVINNADRFFEDIERTESFLIDSDTATDPPLTSDTYTVKSDVPVGTEISYTVVCLSTGRIIGGIDSDAPPRIIIVPRE